MPEYAAIFKPGEAFSRVTSAAVTGGQLLIVSGNDTVAPSSAATSAWLGVAAQDGGSGDLVTVLTGGVHELAASGAIAAGARVVPAAAGAVADIGAGTDYSQVVGVALAAASGGKVRVKLAR
ncbi:MULTISPECIES: capsid cement protein [Nocardia]|uniref:capsid cement protein n=1 Tax=Nocardia TaxID=1817 RepID=UPI0007A4CEF8|nr:MULTISPECIES: capsid cement protein [Nocardia]